VVLESGLNEEVTGGVRADGDVEFTKGFGVLDAVVLAR
jgi:hypothetical protein